jgi:hypothetical protein
LTVIYDFLLLFNRSQHEDIKFLQIFIRYFFKDFKFQWLTEYSYFLSLGFMH